MINVNFCERYQNDWIADWYIHVQKHSIKTWTNITVNVNVSGALYFVQFNFVSTAVLVCHGCIRTP